MMSKTKAKSASTTITAGKIVSPTRGVIENGTITLEDGIISSVSKTKKGKTKKGAQTWSFPTMTIYPGFIEAHGHITIVGEGTGSMNMDGNDYGDPINPHHRVVDSINLDSPELETARKEGILAAAIFPGSSGLIGGMGTAIRTTCQSFVVNDAVIKENIGLKMAFGENPKRVFSSERKFYTRMGALAFLRDYFTGVLNYKAKLEAKPEKGKKAAPREINLKYENGLKLLNREFPARAHAHQANDIQNAVKLSEEYGFDLIIEHGTEADLISDFLKERNIPVVIGPVISPSLKVESRRRNAASAGILAKQGVLTGLMTDAPVYNISMLRLLAGISIKAGMTYEHALQALTVNAAKICGIEKEYGDIKAGMPAHFVVWDGDPLKDIQASVKTIFDGNDVLEFEA